jgi:hypothetical protein
LTRAAGRRQRNGQPGSRRDPGGVRWCSTGRRPRVAGVGRTGGTGGAGGAAGGVGAAGRSLDPADVGVVAGDHPVGVRAPGGRDRRGRAGAGRGWRRSRPGSRPGGAVSRGNGDRGRRARRCSCSPGRAASGPGWARELAACSPVFAARLAECSAGAGAVHGLALEDVLAGADAPALDRVDVVQPALWAVMVSLAAVWEAAGVVPDAVPGIPRARSPPARWRGSVAGGRRGGGGAAVRALTALAGRGAMCSVAEPAARVRERIAAWGAAVGRGGERPGRHRGLRAARTRWRNWPPRARRKGCGPGCCRWTTRPTAPQVEELRAEILAALDGITPRPRPGPDDLGG